MLYLPLGFILWSLCTVHFVFFNSLYFKVYLSYMIIAIIAYSWFPFAGNTFFHSLTFSLYVFLDLKQVSQREYIIYAFYFPICSTSLYLLIGVFNPFTFKEITDTYILTAIFLKSFNLFLIFFLSFLFRYPLLWFVD